MSLKVLELFDDIDRLQIESEKMLRIKKMDELIAQPLDKKVRRSNANVNEFVDILGLNNVVVSTSGGKDSAVLSKLCKNLYPNIQHVMFNTGLEYKATVDLAKEQGAVIIPPHISWVDSCEKHGYPIVSKNVSKRLHDVGNTPIGTIQSLFNLIYGLSDKWLHLTEEEFLPFDVSPYCCEEFKKKPSKQLKLNPIIGTRIQESQNRKSAWKKSGCNSYSKDMKHGVSRPISLWTDNDVNDYVELENVKLSKLYTQYEQKRTGCCICPYGAQIDGSRFDLLKQIEPKRYDRFINHTKLGHILMVSDVDIESDPEYMKQKEKVMQRVNEWRNENKGTDKYLTFRCKKALEYFSKEELIQALHHVHSKGSPLRFGVDVIERKLTELEEEDD